MKLTERERTRVRWVGERVDKGRMVKRRGEGGKAYRINDIGESREEDTCRHHRDETVSNHC